MQMENGELRIQLAIGLLKNTNCVNKVTNR